MKALVNVVLLNQPHGTQSYSENGMKMAKSRYWLPTLMTSGCVLIQTPSSRRWFIVCQRPIVGRRNSRSFEVPNRSIVGSLQYLQVHTGVTTAYPVSVLSRFINDSGPRHIKYLKQLILYIIGTVDDRLIFRKVPMTPSHPNAIPQLQASYMMDANLAGHDLYSQESFKSVSEVM